MASWTREPRAAAEGSWSAYRQMDPSFPPLWHDAGIGLRQASARWHVVGDAPASFAQYLACHPLGMWTELARQVGLRDHARRLEVRRTAWAVRVTSASIADLRSFGDWDRCGLDPWIAVDDDHVASRALADELRAAGFEGVLAPSASLPGAVNLTLFGPRMEVEDDGAATWPRPGYFCPAAALAEGAIPPAAVVGRTRYRGQPHRAYEAHAARTS